MTNETGTAADGPRPSVQASLGRSLSSLLSRSLSPLFNTRAAGIYILLFAASIGVGTFIENDFGTSAAQRVIYRSSWFSLLLTLFCITIAVNVVRFKMVRQKK